MYSTTSDLMTDKESRSTKMELKLELTRPRLHTQQHPEMEEWSLVNITQMPLVGV